MLPAMAQGAVIWSWLVVAAIGCGRVSRPSELDAATGGDAGSRGDASADARSGDSDAMTAGCVIDFDTDCNVGAPGVCNTTWVGGFGCQSPPDACSGDEPVAFGAESDITITADDPGIDALDVYFVHQGDSGGTMTFFNVAGGMVGSPISTDADCEGQAGSTQTRVFDQTVTRIEISVAGTVWIDDFAVSP